MEARSRSSRGALALCLLVIALSLAVRWWQCRAGLPYTSDTDEHRIGDQALHMIRTADYRPADTSEGSLLVYAAVVADVLHYLDLRAKPDSAPAFVRSVDDVRTGAETGWAWELSHPSFFFWNRVVAALAGVGCVALTAALARKLSGAWAAVAAAALLGGLAPHVELSAKIAPVVPAAFLALACVFTAQRFLEGSRFSDLLLSLVLGGLAASTQYEAGLALAAPWSALAASTFRGSFRPWSWVAALAVPPLAFFLGTPYAFLDLPAYLHAGEPLEARTGTLEALERIGRSFGWLASALAAVGTVALSSRAAWRLALAFPLALFLMAGAIGFDLERPELLLAPFVAVAFAGGVAWLHALLRQRVEPRASWVGPVFAAAVALLLAVPFGRTAVRSWKAGHTPETRTQAMLAASQLAEERGWERIALAQELRVHADDLRRFGDLALLPSEELFARRGEFDLIVFPAEYAGASPDAGASLDPAAAEAARERAERLNALRPDGSATSRPVRIGGTDRLFLLGPSRDPAILLLGR